MLGGSTAAGDVDIFEPVGNVQTVLVALHEAPPENDHVSVGMMFPELSSPAAPCTTSTRDEIVRSSGSDVFVMVKLQLVFCPTVVGLVQPLKKPMPCTASAFAGSASVNVPKTINNALKMNA